MVSPAIETMLYSLIGRSLASNQHIIKNEVFCFWEFDISDERFKIYTKF